MNVYIIHHRSDFDGIFCREIAKKFLYEKQPEIIGYEYGDKIPAINNDDNNMLYMLDISIPELMSYKNLVWIDHHKSAIEKYSPTIAGYRIDGVAACRLTWQWFTYKGFPWPIKNNFVYLEVEE